jgi:small subunit ribosomal protein S7
MPRKGPVVKTPVVADPVYSSPIVTALINRVLLHGKRSTAEAIVYGALEGTRKKTDVDPLITLKRALDNIKPAVEASRSSTLALRWLVDYSRDRREKSMSERLQNELIDAANGLGAAVKRREDTHKMAEANKAFAHYRW